MLPEKSRYTKNYHLVKKHKTSRQTFLKFHVFLQSEFISTPNKRALSQTIQFQKDLCVPMFLFDKSEHRKTMISKLKNRLVVRFLIIHCIPIANMMSLLTQNLTLCEIPEKIN